MIVHVSIPSRVSKLDKARGELFAALPVAQDFHREATERAVVVVENAETLVSTEANKAEDKRDGEAMLSASREAVRARAAEEDASKMAVNVQKKLDRLTDTIEGYNLLTGKAPTGFTSKLDEKQHAQFAQFAAKLRLVRSAPNLSAKARKQEIENVWGEMRKFANKCGLPVREILAARS